MMNIKNTLVKESLLKFERGKDPKDVLKIGDEYLTNFNSEEEFLDSLIRRLPKILNTPEIPNNIINEPDSIIRSKYYFEIRDYIEENNLTIQNSPATNVLPSRNYWTKSIFDKLKKMGFKN